MNSNSNSQIKKRLLLWKDSFFIWTILILVQIFIFSLFVEFLLESTGLKLNDPLFQFFGIYGSSIGIWMGILVTEIGTLLISFYYLRGFKKENSTFMELAGIKEMNVNNILTGVVFIPMLFFTGIIVSYFQSYFIYNPGEYSVYFFIFRARNIWELVIWIIISIILVGPCEEIVFRGIIQKGFQNSLKEKGEKEWYAIFFSSLLFSIYHVDLQHFFPILFMGFLLGIIYYKTNSSLVCALSHGIYDSISIMLIFIL